MKKSSNLAKCKHYTKGLNVVVASPFLIPKHKYYTILYIGLTVPATTHSNFHARHNHFVHNNEKIKFDLAHRILPQSTSQVPNFKFNNQHFNYTTTVYFTQNNI